MGQLGCWKMEMTERQNQELTQTPDMPHLLTRFKDCPLGYHSFNSNAHLVLLGYMQGTGMKRHGPYLCLRPTSVVTNYMNLVA